MKAAIAAALSLAAFTHAFPASADNDLKFRGGIGVIPVSSGQGDQATATVVNRNIVRGVQPPGQIWVIEDLKADIDDGGRIRVDGRGLLLGGGNSIGTNANARVFATLLCDNVQHSTAAAGVPLEADGDFRIDDVLVPRPPAVCNVPVLLIRNAANLAWFAAGILKR
jgi:hypothetical protein